MKTCFYCETPADASVPSLVPYCAKCWSEEHPNVRARMERDHRDGLTLEQALGRRFADATVIHID